MRLADEFFECARPHTVGKWTMVYVHCSGVFARIDSACPQTLDAPRPVRKADARQYEGREDASTVRECITHIHVPGISKSALQDLDGAAHEEKHQCQYPVLP